MNSIKIVDYRPGHQYYFELFNRKWIEEFYELEEIDKYVLQNPEEAIISKGGAILMALCDDEVAGTVALRKIDDATFEFTKMAVDAKFRRRGIGEALCYASFCKAAEMGATKIILYSNTRQASAVRLYERIGFKHLPVTNDVYKRANVKMYINLDEELIKNSEVKILQPTN